MQARETSTDGTIRFVALNINQSVKGTDILLGEFQGLREELNFAELHIFGQSEDRHLPGVIYHGPYSADELDAILLPMDVGIIPSLWPETYGYVGPEMLTRGVPLIVSTAGAMTEYVVPNVNGLHFDPAAPGQLKAAMRAVATDPELLSRLKANAATSTEGIVRFTDHVSEMESIYAEVVDPVQVGIQQNSNA